MRDLTPLAGLSRLGILKASFNEIGDLTPFAGLASLKWLFPAYNNVFDLSPICVTSSSGETARPTSGP
ncbi:MAG TPA: hypothetical protein PLC08_02560 [Candidatus Bipolaricaulis sp.]|nr:hypothetical protein [Candidatus Bipolaricaulis sp.]HRS13466.1 hypothetical protein [Candidatus Bipolaricaulis sp.]HRU22104.1 hypothetical protein [Candidatus Bipolaricaulis sp.]